MPDVTFKTPAGNSLSTANGSKTEKDKIFKVLKGQSITGYDDFKLTTIYLSGYEAGTYNISFNITKNTTSMFFLASDASANWQNISHDYKTAHPILISWGVNEDKVELSEDDIVALTAEDKNVKAVNEISSSDKPETDTKILDLLLVAIVIIVFIAFATWLTIHNIKKAKRMKRYKEEKVNAYNTVAQKKFKNADNSLDSYFDESQLLDQAIELILTAE